MRDVRRHFGSSHFLFGRPYGFSASRAFLALSCPSVLLMLPALTSTEARYVGTTGAGIHRFRKSRQDHQ